MHVVYHTRGSCSECNDALWCDVWAPVVCKCSGTTCFPDDASECDELTDAAHTEYIRETTGITEPITFEQI